MKSSILAIGFSVYSGIGKTTLIECFVPRLKMQGFQVAVLKHNVHNFEIDKEYKDSWRFTQAGADITLISFSAKNVFIEYLPQTFQESFSMVYDVDLVIGKGIYRRRSPKIRL